MTGRALNPSQTPQDEAADWFALKRSGAMTAQQLLELQLWLEASSDHRAAFDDAEQSWAMAGALRSDPELMALRERARRTYPAFPRLAAAGVAAAVLAVAGLSGWTAFRSGALDGIAPFARPQEQAFRTGVGQRTTVTLPDGSVVTLDTDTVLRTRESGRRRLVYLDQGRAFFRVAKDASRPFIVEAGGRTVTATGTVFDVRVDPDRVTVLLVEGRVRVEQPRAQFRPGQYADLQAGWRLVARDGPEWTIAPADVGKETGWLQGRLTFVNDPLSQVAAELNRYSDRKIVLRDEAVGREPVVAVFKPGDTASFVKMIKAYRLARVRETDTAIELSAR